MTEKKVMVKIASGLEARPVALFVQVASQFQSSIYVSMQNKKVNAKSIMGMMSLGILEGESILLTAEGPDEEESIEKLETYLTTVE
ncbi:catabolite repression HPr-like protein [Petrocella atlantisensis]|jgi:phosphotransferase system HPr (HPr) family protein|uniref:Catabolite repression HPr-like protein n=1 Tax=Petrocella atlantisensis TaxID=2173034 RepID=A0A3P7PVW5_9FIRM|nr:HPr family phosphocarrier protein [Petrocella atlantisensis]MCF8019218.1 HPr family phosphocarrier protein [Vallitaleaceae bacterium]PKM54655.1 MAG: HPr family phosphocarrier protein [Firmicutes bacterium HGW-Firmicutes-3]VDN47381.1 catabolite repression HPr-like protein [Petrocella atlantisensis]